VTNPDPELELDDTHGPEVIDDDPFGPTSFFMTRCFPQLGNRDPRTRTLDRPPPPGEPP
jgi:hypothetical protein